MERADLPRREPEPIRPARTDSALPAPFDATGPAWLVAFRLAGNRALTGALERVVQPQEVPASEEAPAAGRRSQEILPDERPP